MQTTSQIKILNPLSSTRTGPYLHLTMNETWYLLIRSPTMRDRPRIATTVDLNGSLLNNSLPLLVFFFFFRMLEMALDRHQVNLSFKARSEG